MGLFDKFKDTAKAVASSATEKISSMKEESDKKAAEKNSDVEAIKNLPSIGSVSSFMERPTVAGYYEFCVDVENERFVMRKVSDRKPFKMFDFKQLSSFKHLNTETQNAGSMTKNSHQLSFCFGAFSLEMSLECTFYNDDNELNESLKAMDKYLVLDFLGAVISSVADKDTMDWVYEICEFYGLLHLLNENGTISAEN